MMVKEFIQFGSMSHIDKRQGHCMVRRYVAYPGHRGEGSGGESGPCPTCELRTPPSRRPALMTKWKCWWSAIRPAMLLANIAAAHLYPSEAGASLSEMHRRSWLRNMGPVN